MMAQFSKKKIQALVVAGLISVALLVTGTFAWRSISQQATNKFKGEVNPGARLHDDFNGSNKDIYVENFTDPNNGANVYARIQLKEYMEIGSDAGKASDGTTRTNRNVTVIGKKDADVNDINTWHTHKIDIDTAEAVEFHGYWAWIMGNEDTKVDNYYMPTFNKDNESLDADINGTLEGIDGNSNTGTPYDDYQEWTSTSTMSQKETLNGGVQSTDTVEHTAKKVDYHAKVISMKQWKEEGKKTGAFWVYDSDGWAYWAQAIAPGETTGLLLNEVKNTTTPEESYYYAIHAIAQFATAGDWAGFDGDITSDGRDLLDNVANRLPEVVYMAPKNGYEQFAVAGSGLTLELNMNIKNGTGDPLESAVEWSIDDPTLAYTVEGNVFAPTDEMVGNSYKITATSKLTPSMKTTITVTVLPSGLDDTDTIEGADKKNYIYFGNNVYKRIEDDGSLSEFICAGRDKLIGNGDDKTNVYDVMPELGGAHPQYGRFFLPQGTNRYQAMGTDNMLGTADDIIVTSLTNKWPMNISSVLANKVKVTPADGSSTENVEVKIGQTKQFKAEVYLGNELISNQKVTWSISGQRSKNTTISENGTLTIASDEVENTYINVRAVSKEDPTHASNYITVHVSTLGYEDIVDIEVGSDTVIQIGNIHYYVLANDGEKALLFAKESIRNMDSSSNWSNSIVRTYLNGDWLNNQPDILKNNIIETKIYTGYGNYYSNTKSDIIVTTDKAFLLSAEDFDDPRYNGADNDPRLYTAGIPGIAKLSIHGGTASTWLRSGYQSNVFYMRAKSANSALETVSPSNGGVRPAFWIKLPSSETPDVTPTE